MMRSITIIVLVLFVAVFAHGQSWGDSLLLGKKYYQEKDYDKAYETLLEAQKLAPSHIDLSQDIGNAAYRSKDYEMAEKAFKAAANHKNSSDKKAKYWHNVGNSQMKAKNYQAAIESYKESLRKQPQNDKTRYNLAEAQRRLKIQEKQKQKQRQRDSQDGDENEQQENAENQNNQESQEGQENQQNQPQNQNQQGENGNKDTEHPAESKLTDRKTERMLEDLLKQEMQTKKKVQGKEANSQQQQNISGKKW